MLTCPPPQLETRQPCSSESAFFFPFLFHARTSRHLTFLSTGFPKRQTKQFHTKSVVHQRPTKPKGSVSKLMTSRNRAKRGEGGGDANHLFTVP